MKARTLTSNFHSLSILLLLFLSLSFCTAALAQVKPSQTAGVAPPDDGKPKKKVSREADELFIDEVFKEALPIYIKLDQLKPNNPEINYRIGICYLHTETKNKAIPYLLKAQQVDKKNQFEDINYYLGIAYHHALQFDKAIETFEKYKLLLNLKQDYAVQLVRVVNKYIANCVMGRALVKRPIKVDIENQGVKINSASHEAYPIISPDEKTLYFSSKRIDMSGRKLDEDVEEFEDIYVSVKQGDAWSAAKKVGQGLNTFKHDAPLYISLDGRKLFFYRTDKYNSTDIYFIEYKDTAWTSPKSMGGKVNSPSWETGACLSPDGNTFYFSSDRPGGFGGMDIYFCQNSDKGWTTPKNLGPEINSEWDEEAPYLLPDGKTLYFSNNGYRSIGGFDIFKTVFNEEDSLWSVPTNMGYPINSPEDEVHISWNAEGNRGYLATNRPDSYGEEDVYKVSFAVDKVKPVYVASKDSIVEKTFAKPKLADILDQKVYFDFNIAHSYAEFSKLKLQEVVQFLNTYPEVKIEIRGHADSKGDPDINRLISAKRAETVYRYLLSRGIDSKRLQAKGYSNNQLIVDGLSTIENAPNRRVDFKVLQAPD